MTRIPNIPLAELVVFIRLIDIQLEEMSETEYRNWCTMYAETLRLTDPSTISVVVSLALISHVFNHRYHIGQEWFSFRDRLRTYLDATGGENGELQGLYEE